MPDMDEKPDDVNEAVWAQGFMVRASYRVGNRQGQGSLEMIGQMREVPGT